MNCDVTCMVIFGRIEVFHSTIPGYSERVERLEALYSTVSCLSDSVVGKVSIG